MTKPEYEAPVLITEGRLGDLTGGKFQKGNIMDHPFCGHTDYEYPSG